MRKVIAALAVLCFAMVAVPSYAQHHRGGGGHYYGHTGVGIQLRFIAPFPYYAPYYPTPYYYAPPPVYYQPQPPVYIERPASVSTVAPQPQDPCSQFETPQGRDECRLRMMGNSPK